MYDTMNPFKPSMNRDLAATYGNNLMYVALPGVYGLLSRYWISGIDPLLIATTASYTYVGVVYEVVNETIPRAYYRPFSAMHILGEPSVGFNSGRIHDNEADISEFRHDGSVFVPKCTSKEQSARLIEQLPDRTTALITHATMVALLTVFFMIFAPEFSAATTGSTSQGTIEYVR
ncbi:hypothetical protein SARC_00176 [Sphaeroforma arctica JP610]|uniref:Uncharacterized protein n=1 Tax=Sphaeroforma arctica JP610 TaxID=667725 RepID=A0A0L0GFD8_9EUKA|nr:hypothetical protein SARC_00176 [Sphaeroforma arctica JP610]KNC87742.1 hypothetical protein SARC_00176 [Sphaeroforma arctica JP610]|eukprot:XP_014161644.1 hypothetical protein SARC_00176 [Sphaeroforma arctica JP610]